MSALQAALDEYLDIRRSLGFKLRGEGTVLPKFLRFMEQENASFITSILAVQWAILPENVLPGHWTRRLAMVRAFARFLCALDYRTEIPPSGLLPHRYQRKPPYIYNESEIARLLQASHHLQSAAGLRAATYFTIFGLLAVTGMRISELIALDRCDVDLTHAILTVRQTKFDKSRLIPIHVSTVAKLEQYNRMRDELFPRQQSPSFFVSELNTRITQWAVRWTFVKLSREIGLRVPGDKYGPRMHDLRHTFAVKTLLRWYQTDIDVERHLPELATYLGHTHVQDTYWYLSAVPELLHLASLRLDREPGGELS